MGISNHEGMPERSEYEKQGEIVKLGDTFRLFGDDPRSTRRVNLNDILMGYSTKIGLELPQSRDGGVVMHLAAHNRSGNRSLILPGIDENATPFGFKAESEAPYKEADDPKYENYYGHEYTFEREDTELFKHLGLVVSSDPEFQFGSPIAISYPDTTELSRGRLKFDRFSALQFAKNTPNELFLPGRTGHEMALTGVYGKFIELPRPEPESIQQFNDETFEFPDEPSYEQLKSRE